MGDLREEVAELLSDRPSLEDGLRDIISVDDDQSTWTFDDIAVESGDFGEIVSRGIVEKEGDEYRVSDREALSQVLEGTDSSQKVESKDRERKFPGFTGQSFSRTALDRRRLMEVAASLALVAVFRFLSYESVYRGDTIVLSSNDPYYYRYHVERLSDVASGPFDVSVLSAFPAELATGEPLLISLLWFVAELLGGGTGAVGAVLAWYPLVAGLGTALVVYVIAEELTGDRRVGLAAVCLLAVTPIHAVRTGIGFADHHALDFLLLATTTLALVVLADTEGERRTWFWSGVLAVGIAGQLLAWEAAPLLLLPLAIYIGILTVSALREDEPCSPPLVPIVVGTGLAAVITLVVHWVLGWHEPATAAVPAILFAGATGVTLLAVTGKRIGLSARSIAAIEVGAGVFGIGGMFVVFPDLTTALHRGVTFLLETRGISETRTLFDSSLGGPLAPIFQFGFVFFLGIPFLGWASWSAYRQHEPEWLVPAIYGAYFTLLAVIQVRFGGELSVFLAVFAGTGFVWVANWVDVLEAPHLLQREDGAAGSHLDRDEKSDQRTPGVDTDRRAALSLLGLGVGVGGLGALLTPLEHSQVTIGGSVVEAATWMRAYARNRDWSFPTNYVFSRWGRNRVYNYYVNGHSRSYRYAQANFRSFLESADGEGWYQRLSDRAGFIVVERPQQESNLPEGSLYERLGRQWGQATRHYRVVWTGADEDLKVYTPVKGARVTGPGTPGETVTLTLSADLSNSTREFQRTVAVNEFGVYDATVPLPGVVELEGTEQSIAPADVVEGRAVSAFVGEARARWSLEAGAGDVAYDRSGGHHGQIRGPEWSEDATRGTVLSFEGGAANRVDALIPPFETFTLSLWAFPTAIGVPDANTWRPLVRVEQGNLLSIRPGARVGFQVPGLGTARLVTDPDTVTVGGWNHFAGVYDGTRRAVYVDGRKRAEDRVGGDAKSLGGRLRLGNQAEVPSPQGYAGHLDEVTLYDSALTDSEVASLADDEYGG